MTRGTRVHLRSCPHGVPGIVRGMRRGLIEVEWVDLGITRFHRADQVLNVPESCDFELSITVDSKVNSSAKDQELTKAIAARFLEPKEGINSIWPMSSK